MNDIRRIQKKKLYDDLLYYIYFFCMITYCIKYMLLLYYNIYLVFTEIVNFGIVFSSNLNQIASLYLIERCTHSFSGIYHYSIVIVIGILWEI